MRLGCVGVGPGERAFSPAAPGCGRWCRARATAPPGARPPASPSARPGAHLGNAAAHLPGADYANVLNLHAAFLALRVEVWLNYYHVYVNVNNACGTLSLI